MYTAYFDTNACSGHPFHLCCCASALFCHSGLARCVIFICVIIFIILEQQFCTAEFYDSRSVLWLLVPWQESYTSYEHGKRRGTQSHKVVSSTAHALSLVSC